MDEIGGDYREKKEETNQDGGGKIRYKSIADEEARKEGTPSW